MPEALAVQPSIGNYTVDIVLDGRAYTFGMRWNPRDNSDAGAWYMSIYTDDGTPIRTGIKVVLGVALGAGCVDPLFPAGVLTPSDTSNTDVEAGYDDMGTRIGIFYYTLDELRALVAGEEV